MDAIVSNSMLLNKPPSMPIRTVASSSSFSKFTSSSSSSKSFFFNTRTPRTKVALPRSSNSATVGGFSVTCGVGIREINEAQFSDCVLKSDRPVLVEFVANWCGPCRLISPSMEWVAQEYRDKLTVVKIDHDANPRLIQEYKVYGLPTLILFKNGKEVPESRREGAITKPKLQEYLDTLLESISVV